MALCAGTAWAADIDVPGDYATIQAGVNAASDGDTIHVAAGAYPENVVLVAGNNITLLGAEANVDARAGRAGPESVLDGFSGGYNDAGNGITLPAVPGTVVINGFTITGYTYGIKGTEKQRMFAVTKVLNEQRMKA